MCIDFFLAFPTVGVRFVTHSPGPSQLSPALSSASSVSHNAAAPYGSTDTVVKSELEKNI